MKVGDWVIHNFEIKQIKEIDRTGYNSWYRLSDGYFETSTAEPGTLATYRSKRIANDVRYYYDQLHKKFDHVIRNWPDLNRRFDALCQDMIAVMDDDDALIKKYEELKITYEDIVRACETAEEQEIGGVRLFKR